MRPAKNLSIFTITAAALLVSHVALAAPDPEEACQQGRYAAAARYSACEQKATSVLASAGDWPLYFVATSKCHVKYARTWAKLQAKAAGNGTVCNNPRFGINGDGTVTDRLTGLQWEQKTDDGSIHDRNDLYAWSATGSAADGGAYTTFLASLNSGGCFAGQCDWRLPTRAELLTLMSEGYPCSVNPCVDPALGTVIGAGYWTSTTAASFPPFAWVVDYVSAAVDYNGGLKTVPFFVQAVRGGL